MSSTSPIKGYRPLEPEMIELANQNKLIEEFVLRQVDRHVREHGSQEIDQRWVALARTGLQKAFMDLNRAVFKPTRIEGHLDLDALIKELSR